MTPSIVGATYDLLKFSGAASFGVFDRCFAKACAFLSWTPDASTRRKHRNIAFRHLRTTGYIDVAFAEQKTQWSLGPSTLVERADGVFVVIGSSVNCQAVLDIAPGIATAVPPRADIWNPNARAPFLPTVVHLRAPLPEARAIAQRTGLRLSLSYQERIFNYLPSIASVLKRGVIADEAGAHVFEPNTLSRFDFSSATWQPYTETRLHDTGLYRRVVDYAAPTYFIAPPPGQTPRGSLRVTEREWALVAALALLGQVLPLQYEPSAHRLSLSRRFHADLRLPTLLERCLRSGTLLNPGSTKGWFRYEGITPTSVQRLVRQLPIFEVRGHS